MRKSICALIMIVALSVSALAGDVGTPGRTNPPPPPPCTENCATTQSDSPVTFDEIRVFVIEIMLALIKK